MGKPLRKVIRPKHSDDGIFEPGRRIKGRIVADDFLQVLAVVFALSAARMLIRNSVRRVRNYGINPDEAGFYFQRIPAIELHVS